MEIAINHKDFVKLAVDLGCTVEYDSEKFVRLRHNDAPKHIPELALVIYKVINADEVVPNYYNTIANYLMKVGTFKKLEELKKLLCTV